MSNHTVDVRIVVTAQVEDGDPIVIGHKNVALEVDEDGKANWPAELLCTCEGETRC